MHLKVVMHTDEPLYYFVKSEISGKIKYFSWFYFGSENFDWRKYESDF